MNYLVFLDEQAGELEKILSGTKRMLVTELDPARPACQLVSPGDSLYFLRHKDDCALRVKATVVRVLDFTNRTGEYLSQTLKEMQPKLQLTEHQYYCWSVKKQLMLVEFDSAHKIPVTRVDLNKITEPSDWIAFEEFSLVTE
jgi:hypothetical protein